MILKNEKIYICLCECEQIFVPYLISISISFKMWIFIYVVVIEPDFAIATQITTTFHLAFIEFRLINGFKYFIFCFLFVVGFILILSGLLNNVLAIVRTIFYISPPGLIFQQIKPIFKFLCCSCFTWLTCNMRYSIVNVGGCISLCNWISIWYTALKLLFLIL